MKEQEILVKVTLTKADIALFFGEISESKHSEIVQRLKNRLKDLSA